MVDLLQQCDLPPGVVNLVNGGRDVVERDLRSSRHPRGVVRRLDAGGEARLPARDARRQARAGARRREELRRRHAGRRLRPVDRHHLRVVLRLRRRALPGGQHAGPGRRRAPRGARPDGRGGAGAEGRRRHAARRDDGAGDQRRRTASGARLHREGRQRGRDSCSSTAATTRVEDRPNGYFVGPTVFDDVSAKMAIGREEIFGPVASICPVKTLDEAIAMMQAHPNANATSIFTSSGKAAREFAQARDGVDGRRQHRRRRADGVLPVRRREGQLLRRPEGARPRRRSSSTPTRRSRSRGGSESQMRPRRSRRHEDRRSRADRKSTS